MKVEQQLGFSTYVKNDGLFTILNTVHRKRGYYDENE